MSKAKNGWLDAGENGKRPPWLTTPAPSREALDRVNGVLRPGDLSTVCDWAGCPNIGECYAHGTATFLILGRICTRGCAFCPLAGGTPAAADLTEPGLIARAVRRMGLSHVVITSVTRDDLPGGGARYFALTIQEIRKSCPATSIEVLIPDFQGSREAIAGVAAAAPDVIGHNVETVPRLYGAVRCQAGYERSLEVLRRIKDADKTIWTKSGLMLGLGEQEEELLQVLRDLRRAHCDFLTLGQYLQPTGKHHEVVEYVPPERFDRYRDMALSMGFVRVLSSPLARSSYRAEEMLRGLRKQPIQSQEE